MPGKNHHLRRQGRRWYFQLTIPEDLRKHYGKSIILKTLGTDDWHRACALRDVMLAQMQLEFARHREERKSTHGPATAEELLSAARMLRAELERGAASPEDVAQWWDETLETMAENEALTPDESFPPDIEQAAIQGGRIVQGHSVVMLSEAISRYLAAVKPRVTPQTWRTKQRRLEALLGDLGDLPLERLDRKAAALFITRHVVEAVSSPKTRMDFVSDLRAAAEWWCVAGLIEINPFHRMGLLVKETSRGTPDKTARPRRAWTDAELVRLFSGLKRDKGTRDPLWKLTLLGAYSGMRLNEICEMRTRDVTSDAFRIAEGKTANAVRMVPIHPLLSPWVEQWRGGEWLLPGLRRGGENKTRGHYISKNFGYYKGSHDYPRQLVFHGLRNSFITALDRAGVPESTAALIVGHARQGFSFRTYSDGPEFATMAQAVSRVTYGAADTIAALR